MSSQKEKKWKRLILFLPVILALVAVIAMVRSRKGPEQRPAVEKARQVRVIKTEMTDVVPRISGYGYAEPGQVWQVVPQVSGRIMEVHPAFKKGGFIKEGENVLKIDPAEYRLALAQMEAGIENNKARLAELKARENNFRVSLEIERKSLGLKEKNLQRYRTAIASNSISRTQLDQARIEYHNQSARVQELENSLNLIPATRKTLEAELALNQARLEQAELNLEYTVIPAPFPCRITETKAEIGQFVQKGQTVGTADGTATAEIAAQIPMEKMARIVRSAKGRGVEPGFLNMEKVREFFDLKVKVRVQSGSLRAEWDADFARTDATIDPRTRTMGIIVVVDKPYEQIIMGERPPLARNMFCEVEISGKPLAEKMVIPRSALRDGHVFIMNGEKRLERRAVIPDFYQDDYVICKEGLKAGEWLLVSDIVPAIEGMLLEAVEDKSLAEEMRSRMNGEVRSEPVPIPGSHGESGQKNPPEAERDARP
ncbi:MAG: HlyD family efflux transporter periplasmic adaptor subunit [Desulfococcaceae bacterium]|jgi:multidrug efflux pump subunit AcrA (membrane-fusion protein)|nr:HlyD family efflux transporter periplasmic adaptor subunit [Desulfococcaceae bacterium]